MTPSDKIEPGDIVLLGNNCTVNGFSGCLGVALEECSVGWLVEIPHVRDRWSEMTHTGGKIPSPL
jgi:hypothetical protein